MTTKSKPIVGLLFGDATGIGSELVVKALQNEKMKDIATWVLIGDERVCKHGQEITGLTVDYEKINRIEDVIQDKERYWMIDLKNLAKDDYKLGALSEKSGKVTGETLEYAMDLAINNELDGIVYAPLNKEALHKGGYHFKDEIHFFASLLNCQEGFSELNVMGDLWVTRVTSHVPLKEVSALVTKEKVSETIKFAYDTLKNAGVDKPNIAVAALNPHAGDGGLMGTEEIDEIIPAINEMRLKGVNAAGPYPADTIFLRFEKDRFDALVAMYHDQAQTGMKILGFQRGVTISGGLPIVLTTPAHGTAFDIAGKGIADVGAQIAAMEVAVKLINGQKKVINQ